MIDKDRFVSECAFKDSTSNEKDKGGLDCVFKDSTSDEVDKGSFVLE